MFGLSFNYMGVQRVYVPTNNKNKIFNLSVKENGGWAFVALEEQLFEIAVPIEGTEETVYRSTGGTALVRQEKIYKCSPVKDMTNEDFYHLAMNLNEDDIKMIISYLKTYNND